MNSLIGFTTDKSAYGQGVDDFDPERFFDSEKTSGREHATYGFGKLGGSFERPLPF